MALPNQINATVPAGSDLPSTLDNRLRNLATAVEDILGIPDQTNSTATAMAVSPSGTAYTRYVDLAANPNTTGFFQRNGSSMVLYDGTAVRTFATDANTLTLSNKTLSSPNIEGSITYTPTDRSGTPSTTGAWFNANTANFTDNNTAAAATANSFAAHAFQRPTISASNSSAVTDATTLYVQNAPAAGTNKTIINAWSVWIDDGRARFDGQLAGAGIPIVNEYRMSLTSGTPITTTDITNATTVYVTPYGGNHITLYDGTIWQNYQPGEMSIAVASTANVNFDLFCQPISGTPTLHMATWNNDASRATALTTQDGVYVQSGSTTRRYLGTFRCGPTTGQVFNSAARRHVWNYYNRVDMHMVTTDNTDTWTYNTDTFRQANAFSANQLDVVIGVSEDIVTAQVNALASVGVLGGILRVAVGIDSTTTSSAQLMQSVLTQSAGNRMPVSAYYKGFLAAGRHTLVWLEAADTATTTWTGDAASTNNVQTGIIGTVRG